MNWTRTKRQQFFVFFLSLDQINQTTSVKAHSKITQYKSKDFVQYSLQYVDFQALAIIDLS